jgi:putative membrane protein
MPFTIAISPNRKTFKANPWLWIFIGTFFMVWISTYVGTSNYSNWWLENTLTFLFLIFLAGSYKKYQFSDLSYLLMTVYLCLHVYGAKYTYAENPFGYWLRDELGLARNHYDRIVHFSFGFLLAYPMRELFLKWLRYPSFAAWALPIEITMSVSALYELIEWMVADVFFKAQGDAYLGTQGDIWDAQKDIALAFSGAILATTIVTLVKWWFRVYEEE